jgi:hypothetical protein
MSGINGNLPIPEITRAQVHEIGPNDYIIISTDQPISEDVATRIQGYLQQIFPTNRILVLGDGLKFEVYRDNTQPLHG